MTWHWIDPAAGAKKAAKLLRPDGRLAVFWNIGQPPPDLARAFSEVYQRVLPDTPFARAPSDPLVAYEQFFTKTANEIQHVSASANQSDGGSTGNSATPKTRVELGPTFGGHSRFPLATLDELLAGIGATIDAIGGHFTMRYAAVAITASRPSDLV